MAITIKDKDIDRKLNEIKKTLMADFGIRATKTDAIRFLLKMRKQGKKTNRRWKTIIK